MGKIVFVSSNGLVEGFLKGKAIEIERGALAVFIKIGCVIVIAITS